MAFYQLHQEQVLKTSLEEIWDFISSPENLKQITPPHMLFEITSRSREGKIYPGMIISYKVKPLPYFKTTWVTEITQVENKVFFVDEQRIGPYKMWHHEHWLEATADGVKMTDIITYQPPLGILGTVANHLVIRKKLDEIFASRKGSLLEIFG